MDLSVIIVNWNTRDLILRCLHHLMQLDLPERTEIWMVDNGSDDDSAGAVRQAFPGVHVVANPRNLGFAGANNQALKASTGRYVLLLNSDCFPRLGAIRALMEAVEADPRVGIAGGALWDADGRPQHSFGTAPTLATELLPKGILQTLLPGRYPSKRNPPGSVTEVESVVGAFFMVRREAWKAVGGLDEGYFLFMEETDWCLRMRRADWKVIHVPHACATHLQGQSAGREMGRARVEFHRSRYRFFQRHRGDCSLAVLRWGMLVKGVVNWVSSSLMMRLPGPARGRWSRRNGVDWMLLHWHLRGCPEGWGLMPGGHGGGRGDG